MKTLKFIFTGIAFMLLTMTTSAFGQTMEKDVTIIELTQVEGEFETQELNLKPGKYQFRVVNKSVDHNVGFVIQKESDKDGDVMETAVPNSFTEEQVKMGDAQYTGVVDLTKGDYVFSCPLNPTPHYSITVK